MKPPVRLDQLAAMFGHRLHEQGVQRYADGLRVTAHALGTSEVQAAERVLARDPAAYRKMVGATTVRETYFLRHPEQFALLGRWAAEAAARGEPYTSAWSVGCATGEETYTLAAVLGLHTRRLCVAGSDVSEEALAFARSAVYGPRSFRDGSVNRLSGLVPRGRGWTVSQALRGCVSFHELNLASGSIRPPAVLPARVDVLFCRNVLIYLQPELVASVIAALGSCVKENGLLVLGPVEIPPQAPAGFETVEEGGAFAYRRLGPRAAQRPAKVPRSVTQARAPASAAAALPDAVASARLLANAGRLDEALSALRPVAGQPEALYLSAAIRSERGEVDAAQALLKRMVALQPGFVPAYLQLTLLALRAGDRAGALNHCAVLERLLEGQGDEASAGTEGMRIAYVRQVLSSVKPALEEAGH